MKIIIDTRERLPLDFSAYIDIETEVVTHNVGDYSCPPCPIIFDRKTVGDFIGTMGKGHDRFKNEMERAKASNIQLIIIIEDTWSSIVKGIKVPCYKSGMKYGKKMVISGLTALRTMLTLYHKYGIQHVFCKDRDEMVRYIIEFYRSYFRYLDKLKKEGV